MTRMKACCLPAWYRLCIWITAFVVLSLPVLASAAFYEKDYEVRSFMGKDVLCDPYVVQEDDYVIKILKQRGDIAHKDFPKFLEIFKHINPDVGDIDRVYPLQKILIPLRILPPGTLEGQESGKVSIPVITITNLPRALKSNSEVYRVRYGDWVSRLIAERFGKYGTEPYEKGLELFRKLNPDIEDLDKIRAGSEIRLPDPDIQNRPWYGDLFEDREDTEQPGEKMIEQLLAGHNQGMKDASRDAGVKESQKDEKEEKKDRKSAASPPPVQWFKDISVFETAAEIVDAEIIDKGYYFFPQKQGRDFRLELSRSPVIELDNGKKLLFTRRNALSPGEQMIVQDYWKDLDVVFVQGDPELLTVLEKLINAIDPRGYEKRADIDDSGVSIAVRGRFIYNSIKEDSRVCLNIVSESDMRTPPAVSDYVARHDIELREWVEKDDKSGWILREPRRNISDRNLPAAEAGSPEKLVEAVGEMLGLRYHDNVEISFPYGGFQVKASVAMLSGEDQAEILVDYGSLKGDAVAAIEESGFRVLQIEGGQDVETLLDSLTGILPVDSEKDPIFWTADRPRIYNTSVQIPGRLVSSSEKNGEGGLLVTRASLADALVDYLHEDAGVKVIRLRR